MHNLIYYKEHYGRISFSPKDNNFTSSVQGCDKKDGVSLKGASEEEVTKAFKDYIDELIKADSKAKL